MITITSLLENFPAISFAKGKRFSWSPIKKVVYYDPEQIHTQTGSLALLHEIGHAKLMHKNYSLDIELLNMEVAAWAEARKLAKKFDIDIDENHIEECLETYRLWLYKRSLCPECNNTTTQKDDRTYKCFLCSTTWEVAASKTTQPKRMRCVVFGKN
jgi:hypothetical protein